MEFKKYQHIERYGTTAVQGINEGSVYIFPKLDGTNASLWLGEDGELRAGSRNRELTLDNDNAGFFNWAVKQGSFTQFFNDHPDAVLYGEWLVPHSLKTYNPDAWRRFFVFDVVLAGVYVDYYAYSEELDKIGIDYIPSIGHYWNPDIETIEKHLDINTFLVRDGLGVGEGIVIKNYDFVNRFGNTVWAKIVTAEFKDGHKGFLVGQDKEVKIIEQLIVDEYVTYSLVEKTYAKIELEEGGFSGKSIARLLNTVFYDLITEDCWNFIKKHKNPTIDFRLLQKLTTDKIKQSLPLIFGK